jgi:plasmid stabilization system protein ParE
VASVLVTPTAQRNLDTLIKTHFLPASTPDRVRRSLEQLYQFPLIGAVVPSRMADLRYVLGPWRWMIILYRYYEDSDEVRIVSIQDGRSATFPISR